jgi:hypothetical protein
MTEPNCTDCEKQGVIRKAHRRDPNLCNEHFLKLNQVSAQVAHAPLNGPRTNLLRPWETPAPKIPEAKPATPAKEEEPVPLARTDVDWGKVQTDYEAGLSAQNIAKKYGVHVSSVYLHVKKSARKTPPAKRATPTKDIVSKDLRKHTGSGYDQVIADLRAKAQKLSEIADQLEGM